MDITSFLESNVDTLRMFCFLLTSKQSDPQPYQRPNQGKLFILINSIYYKYLQISMESYGYNVIPRIQCRYVKNVLLLVNI